MTEDEIRFRGLVRRQLEQNFKFLQDKIYQENITDSQAARTMLVNWLGERLDKNEKVREIEAGLPEPSHIWGWAGSEASRFIKLLDLNPRKEKAPNIDVSRVREMDHIDINGPQDIKSYLFQQIDDFVSRNRIYSFRSPATVEGVKELCRQELKSMSASISDLSRILTDDEWEDFILETLHEYEKKMP